MDYFKILPTEITLDILTRLPTELVLECKLVSTTWRNLVSHHPSFSRMHLHHLNHNDSGKLGFLAYTDDNHGSKKFQYFEFNENHESTPIQRIRRVNLNPPYKSMIFVGSCNGLICLAGYPHPSVCICNPITREWVMLQELKRDYSCDVDKTTNFGYVSSKNEYKVLKTFLLKNEIVNVYIYTLGSGIGWRNLGKFDTGSSKPWNQGAFANGALYWLDRKLKIIITFDLDEEKFCEHLSLPLLPLDYWVYNVGVLDEFLSFMIVIGMVENLDMVETIYSDIWLLKKKNDNHDKKEGDEMLNNQASSEAEQCLTLVLSQYDPFRCLQTIVIVPLE